MGNLKPGIAYIYERDGKVVYAREAGSAPSTRFAVGWDYDPENESFKTWGEQFADAYLWDDIMTVAEDNVALQEALERVKIIYYLSKENGT